MISDRFESLAQAFRVFTEQLMRFPALLPIDAPEAVGNLDHAVDGMLNAFHGLYDATKFEANDAFNFYEDPLCALVLRLRNARHHNKANRIQSIYRRARNEIPSVDYILVNFAAGEEEEGGGFAEHYISWEDVTTAMDLEPERYKPSVEAGREAICAEQFEEWCAEHGYVERQIFVNLIPILSAAGSASVVALRNYITPRSVEAEAFLNLFQTVQPADFSRQDYVELTSAAFWPA